jgi:hypothetical protein
LALMLLHPLHGGLLVSKGREHERWHVKLLALGTGVLLSSGMLASLQVHHFF